MAKIEKILLLFFLCMLIAMPVQAEEVWTEAIQNEVVLYSSPSAEGSESSSDAGEDTPLIDTYALSLSVYDAGTISSSYLDWAKGMLSHVPFGKDYVFARTGQYEYIFAVGDFENGFSSDETEIYTLSLSSNYNSSYSYSHRTDTFSLDVNDGLIYSNIAPYPTLKGGDFSYEIVFALSAIICMFGVWSIIRNVPALLRK